MAYELEVQTVNAMKQQLATLARTIVRSLEDTKVSPTEGMLLGFQGMQLGMSILNLVQGLPPEQQKNILHVLEHGEFTLPPGVER